MIQNTLRLNQDKTEFFLIANRNVSVALSDISLKLGELSIQRSTSIKNLGVTFDDSLTMYSQINTICKSVNFHIRNIWRIRRFITTEQWRNSNGLRVGKPAGTRAEGAPADCPFTQAFQLILLFHKDAPFKHFPTVWLRNSHNDAFHKLIKGQNYLGALSKGRGGLGE